MHRRADTAGLSVAGSGKLSILGGVPGTYRLCAGFYNRKYVDN